ELVRLPIPKQGCNTLRRASSNHEANRCSARQQDVNTGCEACHNRKRANVRLSCQDACKNVEVRRTRMTAPGSFSHLVMSPWPPLYQRVGGWFSPSPP